jgi:hypothetical protein
MDFGEEMVMDLYPILGAVDGLFDRRWELVRHSMSGKGIVEKP